MPKNQPYLEVEHATKAGPLYALHNLTEADLAQVRDALRSRRLIQAMRLGEELPAKVRKAMQANADRLDLINATLNPSLHASTPFEHAPKRPQVGHGDALPRQDHTRAY